ncbi:MAG TPA: DUF4214 domain-containing protein [Gemmataceae bacterium]|nr:DUF4214 domain-containing protein [Gemmataceae bacterium]
MAPLRLWRRCRSQSCTCSPVRRPRKWFKLWLEPLEERTLLTSNLPAMAGPAVDGFYQVLLDRMPVGGEDAGWLQAMQNGMSIEQVAQAFLTSPEYATLQITNDYANLLGRQPETGAVDAWLGTMRTTGDSYAFTAGILNSPEYYLLHGNEATHFVESLYANVLGRSSDAAGLSYWSAGLAQGGTRQQVVTGFLDSHEAHALIVNQTYQSLLLRGPEAAGLAGWTALLDGGMTTDQLIVQVAGSAEFARLAAAGMFPSMQMPQRVFSAPAVRPFLVACTAPPGYVTSCPIPAVVPNAPAMETPCCGSGSSGPGSKTMTAASQTGGCCSYDGSNDLAKIAAGADGGSPMNGAYSAAPVRYYDGIVDLNIPVLPQANGFGRQWGDMLSWTNGAGYAANGSNGAGLVDDELPHLVQEGSPNTSIAVVTTGVDGRIFDVVNGAYQERYFLPETLVHNSGTAEFIFTDSTGVQFHFNDFSVTPTGKQGTFKSLVDQDGNVTQIVSCSSTGQPQEMQRSVTLNGTTYTESNLYSFIGSGVNANLVSGLVLRRKVNSGAWSVVRQLAYSYYDGTQTYGGQAGDLMTATVEDASGNPIDTYYLRYYVGENGGYVGGLKYYFDPASYARLVAALGSNVGSLTDTQVASYASNAFQYDLTAHRVTQEVVQGAGCSSCSGGFGTYTFSYGTSTNPVGANSWAVQTAETLPDGNQNIVFSNGFGEPMLSVYHDITTGQSWETFRKFDSSGRLVLQASPSAVTGYNSSYADLLHNQGGNYQFLSDSSGLITAYDYYTTTTAGEMTAGAVAGRAEDVKVQQGELGTAILQEGWQYFSHTANGVAVAPVGSDTVYRNTDGTGAETTNLSYIWYSNTTQPQSITTTLPVVSAAENGPGTSDIQTTVFDNYGRTVWTQDSDGFINYTAYDPVTGAVITSIVDVDTTKTSEFQNLPSGWSTPSGGGLNLVTQMQVDALGRDAQITDPNSNITYLTYNDANHDERIYPGWNTMTQMPTGPTQDIREDRMNSYMESLTMTATPHLTGGVPDGTEAVSNVQTLSRQYASAAGQLVRADSYVSFANMTYSTAAFIGTQNTNYYTTQFGYDDRGRPDRVQLPTGTINRKVYDGLSRVVSTWVGTNDSPANGLEWSPTNNTSPSNMIQVTGNVYDAGAVGDSNLTQMTQIPGGSAANRVQQNFFDWRDRLVASKSGVQQSEDTTTHRPIFYYVLDNLGETTIAQHYDGDGVTITSSNGVPQAPSSSLLREETDTSFDDQGRVYKTQVYDVNQSTGALSSTALTTNTWYNHRGQVIKVANPGGLVNKYQFDGAGRQIESYTSDGGGDTTWTDAGNVIGDNVLSQIDSQYDNKGNLLMTTDHERFHNETGTGALGSPTTAPLARDSYMDYFYDALNRLIATANVGTNGGASYTYPAAPPTPSDTALVTSYSFSLAGWLQDVTDPRGIDTRTVYNALHETTQTIQDYTNGTPTSNTNKTTNYAYDGDGNLLSLTAVEPGGLYQKTGYIYGVTTGAGSTINSNDVLAATQYPDPSTGNPSSTLQETYTVNGLGQNLTKTDRNGNVHTFSFDVLGRQTVDAVTTLGSGVDGSVLRLETAYDTDDRPYLFTSYNAASGGSIVNQVQRVYNGLSQLITEYQANSGAVNTNTTPKVQYAYNELAGSANNSRLVSMTYPNGRVINYNYSSGLNDSISRLSSISDSTATLEGYTYLGLSTVVDRSHPQPGIDLTYIKQTGEANGDAGDQYTGLDRFGRVVDQRWLVTATGVATDRFQYTYDRDGNPLSRNNLVNTSFGELYESSRTDAGYDNLNQLTNFERGVLSSSVQGGPLDTISSPSHSQSWSYDALGNWSSFVSDSTTQTRTANQQNEITSISGQTTPGYDANGNTTTDQTAKTLVYDAWNRLVAYKSGSTVLVSYSYDLLGRRVTENPGTLRNIYFSAAWQVLEEDVGGSMQDQYIWSRVYIDAMIERDTPSQRLYLEHDLNWNVTAIVDASGNVQERYAYDPFGTYIVLASNWSNRGTSSFGWVYLHQGARFDGNSGLYNFRNREYSPTLGRWINADPIGFSSGDENLYRDERNLPTIDVDGLGLDPTHYPIPYKGGAFGGSGIVPSTPPSVDPWNPNATYDSGAYLPFLKSCPASGGVLGIDPEVGLNIGCIGLCMLRCGSGQSPNLRPGTKCFLTFEDAYNYRNGLLGKGGGGSPIVVGIKTHGWQPELGGPDPLDAGPPAPGQTCNPRGIGVNKGGSDFCTLFEPGDDKPCFWEHMGRARGGVIHTPLNDLCKNPNDKRRVFYCVILASGPNVPPVPTQPKDPKGLK